MKKNRLMDMAIFILLILLCAVIIYFLPTPIPIHFDWHGNADVVVPKYYLFFVVVIPYSLYWKYRNHR